MTPTLVGLLLVVLAALAVVFVVAFPHLREGSSFLTPEGERLAKQAKRRAQTMAGGAVERATDAAATVVRAGSGRGAQTGPEAALSPAGPVAPSTAAGVSSGPAEHPAGVQVRRWDSVVAGQPTPTAPAQGQGAAAHSGAAVPPEPGPADSTATPLSHVRPIRATAESGNRMPAGPETGRQS